MRVASARAAWFGMCKIQRHERKWPRRYGRVKGVRYVRVSCPSCDTATAHAIEDAQISVECPACGQKNTNLPTSHPLTGRCGKCTFPLDEHVFYNDMIVECPRKGVAP